ncbi:hypothetical protein PHYSODRAFT_301381 [Phytophthora sojae]|uniref:Uncharacterized protein n=1 Tax=Phytophthora sojae (strain P6497) TaxID=1094619 RepID=G4ZJW0_PHYSP|nr:hypothetical protein PHYSODRAFT_301381 [Phytophthora sojae]EGZ18921.1 hypothetical protein PHYSODRAFT_301381 [Phytophthora sojae]|eukprot:XP_009527979.1 hypothetical protein PHYSODRAFT_301381 [Phytophthora sojae]
MATRSVFALFKPGLLDTRGYAYGQAELLDGDDAASVVDVRRVNSGRWSALGDFEVRRPRSEMLLRAVSEEEATGGIGTYVGACACVARVPPSAAPSWNYGAVAGYSWGTLVHGGEHEIEALEYAPYTLRPCNNRPIIDLMPAEMRAIHAAALNHFKGVGCRATRRSKSILEKLQAPLMDEDSTIVLYDASKGRICRVSTKYVLDYAYYKEGGRRIPRGVALGDSIFETPTLGTPGVPSLGARIPTRGATGAVEPAMTSMAAALRDSDEDDDDDVPQPDMHRPSASPPLSAPIASRKRTRDIREALTDDMNSLSTLRDTYATNPAMVRQIDRLLSLNQPASTTSDGATSGAADTKAQFRPTAIQRQINRQLINGSPPVD